MTSENSAPFHDGPFLLCAILCERVLHEQDGVKTAVRMVDRITHTVSAPSAPAEMEPFEYEITLLVRLKAGSARGTMPLEIRFEKPDGTSTPSPQINVYFEGDADRGVDIVIPMKIQLSIPGLHWMDIVLQDIRITRVPLRVIYNPIRPALSQGGASPELPPNP